MTKKQHFQTKKIFTRSWYLKLKKKKITKSCQQNPAEAKVLHVVEQLLKKLETNGEKYQTFENCEEKTWDQKKTNFKNFFFEKKKGTKVSGEH